MAERILKAAGWLDECEDGLLDVGSLVPPKSEYKQSFKAWRAAVLVKKQPILDERSKHFPANCKSNGAGAFRPDTVEIVDKRYIDQAFQHTSKTDTWLLEDAISEYNLNTEQERAFQIITNHFMMEKPEKLRMYLGGMEGTGKSQVIKAVLHFFAE